MLISVVGKRHMHAQPVVPRSALKKALRNRQRSFPSPLVGMPPKAAWGRVRRPVRVRASVNPGRSRPALPLARLQRVAHDTGARDGSAVERGTPEVDGIRRRVGEVGIDPRFFVSYARSDFRTGPCASCEAPP